jgi:NAD(P)-dependent dehydrogenase (short-subunit alcohol dehydrogenase family)
MDLLINSAGVMAVPRRQVTEGGFELQFGTNFLGPCELMMALLPALIRAQSPRVTMVSSGAAKMGLRRRGCRAHSEAGTAREAAAQQLWGTAGDDV